jgi:hypothetical protein
VLKNLSIEAGIFFVLAITAWLLLRNGTLYIHGKSGYSATTTGSQQPNRANREQLRKVVARILPGDLFDMLWVSWSDDEYTGLILGRVSAPLKLSVRFKTHSEQARLEAFKSAMTAYKLPMEEASNGFSGGASEKYRVTTVEYTLPKSPEEIVDVIDTALTSLHGAPSETYFLKGSLFAHGPGSGPGIKFSPAEDPLRDILAAG